MNDAVIVARNIKTEFKIFKLKQLLKPKIAIFNNYHKIEFYSRFGVLLSADILESDFTPAALKQLKQYGKTLIKTLYKLECYFDETDPILLLLELLNWEIEEVKEIIYEKDRNRTMGTLKRTSRLC